jgi:Starch binding domain.
MTHCCISFKVKFFTELSESIRVLGNVDQLGNWNPSKAHELITTPETYPDWISPNPIRLPSGISILFIY